MLREAHDVVAALPQRGQVDDDDGEPVVQVLAKAARAHRLRQVGVRRREDPDVHVERAQRAEPADALLLDRLQELPLEVERHRPDLVEE
jgi:hypothetical protein